MVCSLTKHWNRNDRILHFDELLSSSGKKDEVLTCVARSTRISCVFITTYCILRVLQIQLIVLFLCPQFFLQLLCYKNNRSLKTSWTESPSVVQKSQTSQSIRNTGDQIADLEFGEDDDLVSSLINIKHAFIFTENLFKNNFVEMWT